MGHSHLPQWPHYQPCQLPSLPCGLNTYPLLASPNIPGWVSVLWVRWPFPAEGEQDVGVPQLSRPTPLAQGCYYLSCHCRADVQKNPPRSSTFSLTLPKNTGLGVFLRWEDLIWLPLIPLRIRIWPRGSLWTGDWGFCVFSDLLCISWKLQIWEAALGYRVPHFLDPTPTFSRSFCISPESAPEWLTAGPRGRGSVVPLGWPYHTVLESWDSDTRILIKWLPLNALGPKSCCMSKKTPEHYREHSWALVWSSPPILQRMCFLWGYTHWCWHLSPDIDPLKAKSSHCDKWRTIVERICLLSINICSECTAEPHEHYMKWPPSIELDIVLFVFGPHQAVHKALALHSGLIPHGAWGNSIECWGSNLVCLCARQVPSRCIISSVLFSVFNIRISDQEKSSLCVSP